MTSSYQFNASYELWAAALASSASIGLTSLVPWMFNLNFIDDNGIDSKDKSHAGNNSKGPQNRRLKLMLSFAVGSILGDIFLHLIPESINSQLVESQSNHDAYKKVGLSIISGVLMFIIVEKLIENLLTDVLSNNTISLDTRSDASVVDIIKKSPSSDLTVKHRKQTKDKKNSADDNNNNNSCLYNNYYVNSERETNNNISSFFEANGSPKYEKTTNTQEKAPLTRQNSNPAVENKVRMIETAGYLNLIANGFDNFTHGLAVGASFLVGFKVGLLTTFVIIIHEIPHEICDYAILVKSGFNRWDAVRAQSSTAIFGVLGTITALSVKSMKALSIQTGWILPFSSGGFLYIALVNILPELLDDRTSSRDSFNQILCILVGISFMAMIHWAIHSIFFLCFVSSFLGSRKVIHVLY